MFVFYAYQKIVGQAESRIWSELYFRPEWQAFFDVFNSVPICGALLLVTLAIRRHGWSVFFASMLLHAACDLPLHYDDAHRHFWPLTDWRFQSPVSYWDPRHFGWITAPTEAVFAIVGSVWLVRDRISLPNRVLGRLILFLYSVVFCVACAFLLRSYWV